jgi:zinc protease
VLFWFSWVGVASTPALTAAQTDDLIVPRSDVAPERDLASVEVNERRLDNGLRVILEPTTSPLTSICVSYDVGWADDPPGRAGLAHLVEHLMFGPTREVPEGYLPFYERLGAVSVQGTTDEDHTTYCASFPEEALELVLFAEAERMGFLLEGVDDATVRRELRILAHEARERGSVEILEDTRRAEAESAWGPGHPYAWRAEELDALDLDAVRWLHQHAYGPANATVAIVTRREVADTFALATRSFERLRGRPSVVRESPAPIRRNAPVLLEVGVPLTRSSVRIRWETPAWWEADDAALDVVAGALREQLAETWESARARVHSKRDASFFEVEVEVEAGTDLGRVEARIGRLVTQLPALSDASCAEHRARWVELERERTDVVRARELAHANRASAREPARGSAATVARYADLDCEAIRAAATRWLRPNARHTTREHSDRTAPLRGRVLPRRGIHAR